MFLFLPSLPPPPSITPRSGRLSGELQATWGVIYSPHSNLWQFQITRQRVREKTLAASAGHTRVEGLAGTTAAAAARPTINRVYFPRGCSDLADPLLFPAAAAHAPTSSSLPTGVLTTPACQVPPSLPCPWT